MEKLFVEKVNSELEILHNKLKLIGEEVNLIKFAISDPKGMGKLALMMNNALIPKKYEYIFYKMRDGDICIDCGANIGLIIDIIDHQQGKVYAFEPNKDLFKFLEQKYLGNQNIKIYDNAVYDKDITVDFNIPSNEEEDYLFSSWCGSISKIENTDKFVKSFQKFHSVKAINLTSFILEKVLSESEEIYLLKIDIEGAEFEVIESLIKSNIYKKIKYIVCETHERFFKDGKEKLEKILKEIEIKKITNIYLDWI